MKAASLDSNWLPVKLVLYALQIRETADLFSL